MLHYCIVKKRIRLERVTGIQSKKAIRIDKKDKGTFTMQERVNSWQTGRDKSARNVGREAGEVWSMSLMSLFQKRFRFLVWSEEGACTCEFRERNKKEEVHSRPLGFSWLKQEANGLRRGKHMREYSKKVAQVRIIGITGINGTITLERSCEADQLV